MTYILEPESPWPRSHSNLTTAKPLTKEHLLYIYNQLPNWGMDLDSLPPVLEKFARLVEKAHGIE